jgi:hypothetical protein
MLIGERTIRLYIYIFFYVLVNNSCSSIDTFGGNRHSSIIPIIGEYSDARAGPGHLHSQTQIPFSQFDRLKLERSTWSISFPARSTVHYSPFDIACKQYSHGARHPLAAAICHGAV